MAAPTLACGEAHPVPDDAATQSDAFVAADARPTDDAASAPDAIARVDAGNDAATEWMEDAGIPEVPDAYYPDGLRG